MMPNSLTTDLMGFLTISGLVPLTCNYSQSESVFLFCFFTARLFPNHPLVDACVWIPVWFISVSISQRVSPTPPCSYSEKVTVHGIFSVCFCFKNRAPVNFFQKLLFIYLVLLFFFLYDSSHFGLLGTGGKHLNSFQYNFDLLNLSVSVLLKTFTTFQREILYCYTFI